MGHAGHDVTHAHRAYTRGSLRTMRIEAEAIRMRGQEVPLDWIPYALAKIAVEVPDRFEAAAVRWVARLAAEREVDLEQLSQAVVALEALPSEEARDRLVDLAR